MFAVLRVKISVCVCVCVCVCGVCGGCVWRVCRGDIIYACAVMLNLGRGGGGGGGGRY